MKECPKCGTCLEDDSPNCPNDGSSLNESLDGARLIDGKYLLERCLGRGGMGTVYQAQHVELQKPFALKLILHSGLSDPAYVARFQTEAKALGKLQHPNIVQVTDYGIDPRNGGIPYLVMEYMKGRTLLQHISYKGSLTIEEAFPILESIASAIDYAHSRGILHRDLNLKNVFLVKDLSGKLQVKILDFGLARIVGQPPQKEERVTARQSGETIRHDIQKAETQTIILDNKEKDSSLQNGQMPSPFEESQTEEVNRLTQAGTVMGTPGYIAPEIFKGLEATPASDIFSFGVLAYEVLVGNSPFKDSSVHTLPEHILETPPLPSTDQSTVPPELDQPILAPLNKDPNKRPAKALDAIHKLKHAFAGYKYRTWRNQEVPKRIQLAGVLTIVFLLFFLLLQGLPIFQNIENFMVDVRFQLFPQRPPEKKIIIISIDEATLKADPKLLAEKADEMGILLQGVLDAGARGIAVDFLLPERWNQSESFAKLILKNQEKLVLASYITEDGDIIGMECIKGLIMTALGSTGRAEALFGFLNMKPDPDGCIRRVQIGLQNKDGRRMFSMPARAFQVLTGSDLSDDQMEQRLWIDYSIDRNRFQRISWKDLPFYLNQRPGFFHNKIVLVGGEFEGSQDYHRVPKRAGLDDEASGLVIQALTIHTLLEDKLISDVSGSFVSLPLATLFMFFSASFLIRPKVSSFLILLFILLAFYVLLAYFMFILNRQLLPVGFPFLILIFALVPVFWVRRKLTFVAKPSMEVN